MPTVSGMWLLSLITIFGALLLYFTLTPAFEEVYLTTYNATTIDAVHTTQNMLMWVWNAWCPIIVVGALLMGFAGSQRRDPGEEFY